ncbi:MAG: rod shape-determining protein MreD [Anaerolineae bacterium]
MSPWYYLLVPLLILLGVAQSTLVPFLRIAGLHPDLVMILVAIWSVLRGYREGTIWALICGLMLDMLSGMPFGACTLALLGVSLLMHAVRRQVYRLTFGSMVLLVTLATPVYYGIILFALWVMGGTVFLAGLVSRVIMPAALLNAATAAVVFWPLRWFHQMTGEPEMSW